jgi:hypothetical protein
VVGDSPMSSTENAQMAKIDQNPVDLEKLSQTGVNIISEDVLIDMAKGSLRNFILKSRNIQ